MSRLYLRGEIQQAVVVRIPRGWKRRHFHPRLTYTRSLGDIEPVPVPCRSCFSPATPAGTRNCLFQCRLGATRRLRPCEEREQVEKKKDTLTEEPLEHHGTLNIRFMTSQAKSLPSNEPRNKYRQKEASQGPSPSVALHSHLSPGAPSSPHGLVPPSLARP